MESGRLEIGLDSEEYMEYTKFILESNLVSVIAGGLISLTSVYFIEYLNERKTRKNSKLEVYKEIKSTLIRLEYFTSFVMQFDILFSYHKRVSEITGDAFHVKEGQRRHLQLEEYQTKIVEMECVLEQLVAQYHYYFGKDEKFDALLKSVRDWQTLPFVDYSNVSDLTLLNKIRTEDERRNSEKIENTLGKQISCLAEYINGKSNELF